MTTHRKLAAILAADAAGYSRLMADDEAETLRALNESRALFRRRIEAHGGRLIDTAGDSVLAEFPSAVEAVDCANEIQRELSKRNHQLAEHRRMQFRIGINLGDVIEQEDGTIYGDGVNVAARIQQLAEAAGICISGTAFDHVEGKLPLTFKFIGEQQVKNIAKAVRVYRVLDAQAVKSHPARRPPHRALALGAAAVMVVMLAVGAVWKTQKPAADQAAPSNDPALAIPTGPAIAVLPFTNMSDDPKQEYFADGITEEIISGLSRFPNLRVLARNTTFQYKGKSKDVREIGREIHANYVVEGSVRKADDSVRVTVQLLDATNGTHVWTETYERRLDPKNLFAVQDEITSQVVTRIGDIHGAVNWADVTKTRAKSEASLDDYECILRTYEYQRFLTPDKHAVVKACLTRTVERNPRYADAWANLAYTYVDQYWTEYEGPPDPLERAYVAARKAVELDPNSQVAHFSLANVYFFRKELDKFFREAEKALAFNPNNTEMVASLGNRFVYAGKPAHGLALMKKAMSLNPSHPGWYWFPFVWDHYWNRNYAKALEAAQRIDVPDYFYTHVALAACYGQLGQHAPAIAAVREFRRLNPAFAKDPAHYLGMWFTEEDTQYVIDGLRKAGLEIREENR